jgi:uncharacterized phiE125 gp8 family phage protein
MQGEVTGQIDLIDRYPFGESIKAKAVDSEFVEKHLQIEDSPEASLVTDQGGYLDGAIEEVEARGSVALVTQKRRLYIGTEWLQNVTDVAFDLVFQPVQSIESVKYLDIDYNEVTLTANIDYRRVGNTVYFLKQPALGSGPGTLWIDFIAGFGNTHLSVPAVWKNLVCQLTMRRFERREGAAGSGDAEWERMIDRQIVIAGGNRRCV